MYCRFDGTSVVDKMGKPRRHRRTCTDVICTRAEISTHRPAVSSAASTHFEFLEINTPSIVSFITTVGQQQQQYYTGLAFPIGVRVCFLGYWNPVVKLVGPKVSLIPGWWDSIKDFINR